MINHCPNLNGLKRIFSKNESKKCFKNTPKVLSKILSWSTKKSTLEYIWSTFLITKKKYSRVYSRVQIIVIKKYSVIRVRVLPMSAYNSSKIGH